MKQEPDDGGPAFPRPPFVDATRTLDIRLGSEGMSLRDWFAGMALQGDLASESRDFVCIGDKEKGISRHQMLAASAYSLADAMLAERSK